jgi:hypothetical protein
MSTAVPSPQSIRHCAIVSCPGSVAEKLSVYAEPSLVAASPLVVMVGETSFTTVVPVTV